ncbi:MAG: hypothetical protein IT364_08475, partial [Candidatus Hydrogenedentes bacterium]|nr:hypothetical protein [Candidatus Hydrogenedentota bacterium]
MRLWIAEFALVGVAFAFMLNTYADPVLATDPAWRHVYVRGETAAVTFEARGATTALADIDGWLPEQVEINDGIGTYSVNTALLRAGDYLVRVSSADAQGGPIALSIPL